MTGTPTPWKNLVTLTVELGVGTQFDPTGHDVWNTALWNTGRWSSALDASWTTITGHTLSIAIAPARQTFFDPPGAATCRLELWNEAGLFTPEANNWYMGRLIRLTAKVGAAAPFALFYGQVDRAAVGGNPGKPTVTLDVYDLLASAGAQDDGTPPAVTGDTASGRITTLLRRQLWPPERMDITADATVLLPDTDSAYMNVMGRAAQSAGGLLWADGGGIIRYRPNTWYDAFSSLTTAFAVVVGTPGSVSVPVGCPVVAPTDLTATEAIQDVQNEITYGNTDPDTPDLALAVDRPSINRYGHRPNAGSTRDLATADPAVLATLAARHLALTSTPNPRAAPATVTIWETDSAKAATLFAGQRVLVAWTANGGTFVLDSLLVGVGHNITARKWDVDLHTLTMDDLSATARDDVAGADLEELTGAMV